MLNCILYKEFDDPDMKGNYDHGTSIRWYIRTSCARARMFLFCFITSYYNSITSDIFDDISNILCIIQPVSRKTNTLELQKAFVEKYFRGIN